MNREDMRDLLRRRLKDEAEVDLADSSLNSALNEASTFIQADVELFQPGSLLTVTRQNIEADENLYRKPAGIWALVDVALKDTSTNRYVSLGEPVDLTLLRSLDTSGPGTKTRFGFFGEHIMLSPTPSEEIVNGLEWIFGRSAQMATDEDLCPLHIGLHQAVVIRAQLLLMPELVGGATDELRKLLAEEMARILSYYRRTVGHELGLRPMIDKMSA